MTNLKDKLSASVRMAKAGQQTASQPANAPAALTQPAPVSAAADKPVAVKPAAKKPTAAKPAATKPTAAKPAATKPTATKQPAASRKPASVDQESGNALFPSRVWPDCSSSARRVISATLAPWRRQSSRSSRAVWNWYSMVRIPGGRAEGSGAARRGCRAAGRGAVRESCRRSRWR